MLRGYLAAVGEFVVRRAVAVGERCCDPVHRLVAGVDAVQFQRVVDDVKFGSAFDGRQFAQR